MHRHESLGEMLLAAAESARADAGYRFLDGSASRLLTFAELAAAARRGAAHLQEQGLTTGERVLMILTTGADFAVAYYAAVLCGAVPCVLAAPGLGNAADGLERIGKVAAQLDARHLIARASHLATWLPGLPALRGLPAEEIVAGSDALWTPVAVRSTDLAYIQATSGSTGLPKCVALTHGNLLSNMEQIGRALRFTEDDVLVGWLPLFHDMGLIGCFLQTTYWRFTGVLMSPYRFLRNPVSFLQAISEYRGTSSGNPTFAYALMASRVSDAELAALDLSSWTRALCGSEPVSTEALERFAQKFRPCGFSGHRFVPCYGLAEASLAVTMHPLGAPLRTEQIDRTALAHGLAEPGGTDGVRVTDCGPPVEGTRVVIRDDAGAALPEGVVGHIWVAGPSVMQSYFQAEAATAETLQDGWLRTGDLGYLRDGRLLVTGRQKELVIIRGQKWPPTDFEVAAAEVAPGRVVAFGVAEAETGTEGLCILCEEPRQPGADLAALGAAVQRHVITRTGVLPARVEWIPRNALPHTTSGKLQRSKARELYLAGSLARPTAKPA